ncbi:MAG TPA: VOC family protein [Pirellulaceae bacterium]|nr:VOC family protein [Pirellulaceae bacterium]
MPVSPIPAGYHSVTPYLIVSDGQRAIEFYKRAFGATEVLRLQTPDGKIGHAEVKIGDCHVMLADEFPEMGAKSPQSIGGTPVGFCIYLADVDAAFDKAVTAGGKVERPVQDQFYGDRSGTILDPFGHKWTLATHIEDVPQEEVERRFAAMMEPA